ncbi:MAG TPA: C4-type zinc ribbon domain-containing protein [candidate division Zixibacteria bacterium]|nr:C4-type zinc ribbon domain-containing protein [candidate division Zixibacteria bacterium]
MIPDLERLIELQKVDAEVARLNAEIAALPKHVAAIEAKLAKSKERVEKAKAAIKADETARRKHEQNIQDHQQKIIKHRETSASVKTNEQYRALMSEIEFTEKAIRAEEDKILELMMAADARVTELKQAESLLATETAEVNKEKKETEARTEEDRKQMAAIQAKRQELRQAISEDILRQYDRVHKTRGSALAEARDQRCTACQVMLRPQVFAEVRKGDVVHHCDTCGRLLYYIVQEKSANLVPADIIEREWMYVPNLGTSGAFVIFQNAKGNATLKAYDAVTGAALEKRSEKEKTFQTAWAHLLERARNIFVDEANLEDHYKEQLPPEVLEDMQHQLPAEWQPASGESA